MHTLIIITHIFVSIFLCLTILLQSGRGGGMGAAFGGASSQIFGGRGAGNFLSRLTSICATVFFLTSLTLSMMSSRHHSVVQAAKAKQAATTAPGTGSNTAVEPGKTDEGKASEPAGSAAPAAPAAPAAGEAQAPAPAPAAPAKP
jgi:preprotein translocase subunit SecG